MSDVKKEATELLNKFAKDLHKIDVKLKISNEGESFRKEGSGEKCSVEFKTIMFKNAKHKDDMCLLLEKGSWN